MAIMFISVALPVFNGRPYVAEAITSILAQDYDFELIVSDDASSDNTVEVVRGIKDRRLRLLVNADNAGIFGNLNRCLDAATGDAVQLFSQDDIMCAGFLASQAAALIAHPDAGLVYGTPGYISADGSAITPDIRDETPERIGQALYVWIASHYAALPASISSVMIPRATFETVGVFNPAFRVAGDIEFYNRVAGRFVVVRNKEPLHKVRSHQKATSALSSAGPLYLQEEAALQSWYRGHWSKEDFAKVRKFRASARGAYHLGWIRRAALAGDIPRALKALWLLHSLYPLPWVVWWQVYNRLTRRRLKPFIAPP